jgi:hypothetical protein
MSERWDSLVSQALDERAGDDPFAKGRLLARLHRAAGYRRALIQFRRGASDRVLQDLLRQEVNRLLAGPGVIS